MIKNLHFDKSPTKRVTLNDVAEFEQQLRIKLPTTFVTFCIQYNGGFTKKANSWYPVPSRFQLFHAEYHNGKGGITIDGLYGLTSEFQAIDFSVGIAELAEISGKRLLPISFDLGGDCAVVIEDEPGDSVYWFDHEMWETPSKPLLFPIADSLEELYNGLTTDPYIS